jgi:hypothetical protein
VLAPARFWNVTSSVYVMFGKEKIIYCLLFGRRDS